MIVAEDVLKRCTACYICVNECLFLMRARKTPREISEGILGDIDSTRSYVFSCFLCKLCTSVCPQRIDVAQMFLEARSSLASSVTSLNPYIKLLLCDEPSSLINIYKERKRADYYKAQITESFRYAFLPGCSMIYFSPKSISKIHGMLSEVLGDVGILDVCCGKPMHDLGLRDRAMKWLVDNVIGELNRYKCSIVIVACPNCYYYLKSLLPRQFEVATVYDMLGREFADEVKDLTVTIHDSCPDRFDGIFAKKVREMLARCIIVEMEHSKSRTMCCGAGGLVAYTNPSLSLSLASSRIQEALSTRAEVLITYCYTCTGMLSSLQPPMKVKHILDLSLKVEESYTAKQEELLKIITELVSGSEE